MCFICTYSETKNKEVEKKRRQAYPFSLRMISSIVHEGKREREKKKKKTARNGLASQPPSPICPSQLALNSWSELWVTLPATCPALGTGERPFFVAHSESENFSSSPVIYMCVCVCVCVVKEREREREIKRGVRGVMTSVVGSGPSNTSSNPGGCCLHFT